MATEDLLMDTCDRYALHEKYKDTIKCMLMKFSLDFLTHLDKHEEMTGEQFYSFVNAWADENLRMEKKDDM